MKRTRTEQENETRTVGLGLHGLLADTTKGVSGSPLVTGVNGTTPVETDSRRGVAAHVAVASGVVVASQAESTPKGVSDCRRDWPNTTQAFTSFRRSGFALDVLLEACSKDDPNSIIKGDR